MNEQRVKEIHLKHMLSRHILELFSMPEMMFKSQNEYFRFASFFGTLGCYLFLIFLFFIYTCLFDFKKLKM
jgi:hypothetical protein